MGRKSIGLNKGLVLIPCAHVHTLFMRFPLCILHCDETGRLLKYSPWVKPWRFSLCARSTMIFEFNACRFSSYNEAQYWVTQYFNQTSYEKNP